MKLEEILKLAKMINQARDNPKSGLSNLELNLSHAVLKLHTMLECCKVQRDEWQSHLLLTIELFESQTKGIFDLSNSIKEFKNISNTENEELQKIWDGK